MTVSGLDVGFSKGFKAAIINMFKELKETVQRIKRKYYENYLVNRKSQ